MREHQVRKAVHRAIRWLASHTLQRVQRVAECDGTSLQRCENVIAFLRKLLVRRVAFHRRVHDHRGHDLARQVGAESDGRELQNRIQHALIPRTDEFHETTATTAFTVVPFADTLEARQGDPLVQARLEHDFAHALELFAIGVDVFLVHFVGDDEKSFIGAELGDIEQVVIAQHVTRRVTRVDDDERANVFPLRSRRVQLTLDVFDVHRPPSLFVQVVRRQRTAIQR